MKYRKQQHHGLASGYALAIAIACAALLAFSGLGDALRRPIVETTPSSSAHRHQSPSLGSRSEAAFSGPLAKLGTSLRTPFDSQPGPSFERVSQKFPRRQPARFEALQRGLPRILERDHDIVLMPSISLDGVEDIVGLGHYEERSLVELAHLRNPKARVHLVTSAPIKESTIRLMAEQLGLDDEALSRLYTYSPTKPGSTRWLSTTALVNPDLIASLRKNLRQRRTYMSVFAMSQSEKQLALELGIPVRGPDPDLQIYWGGKSGSRVAYQMAGIDLPEGAEHLYSKKQLLQAMAELWERNPKLSRIVLKLDQGSSGQGNALLDLRPLVGELGEAPTLSQRRRLLARQLKTIEPANENWSADRFLKEFSSGGAIEAFIDNAASSPSVQVEIMANGEVRVLSTHEQLLAGPGGQVYQGCVFPGACDYRPELQEAGRKVGEVLRDQGVIGRFAIDFMSRQEKGVWKHYAVDLNMRKGGTTHPYQWTQAVTGAEFDLPSGTFRMPDGTERVYIGTDNFKRIGLKGKSSEDLLRILDQVKTTLPDGSKLGSFFHLVGTMPEYGKVGFTTVGRTQEEAQALYNRTVKVLEELAARN